MIIGCTNGRMVFLEGGIKKMDQQKAISGVKMMKCCICNNVIIGLGNNAQPLKGGRCCDDCNIKKVIPYRLKIFKEEQAKDKEHLKRMKGGNDEGNNQ